MAVRQTADLPGSLRSTDKLPNTRSVFRCIDEKFVNSKSSGNPMIQRTWEVVLPEIVNVNGKNFVLAGTKLEQYLTTISFNPDTGKRDDAKSDKALARLRDENKSLGLSWEAIDDENPALECKGVYADGTAGSEEYTMKMPATPEQLAQGIKVGADRIGADGKPEKGYRVKLVGILGKATPVPGHPW